MPFVWQPEKKPLKKTDNLGRTFVICNPHANRDRHRPLISKEIKCLEEAGIDFIYAITEKPMDEYYIAKKAIEEGFDTIVASGGDSTVSNIADAILSTKPGLKFGIIPSGTGNDYATGNNIPRSLPHAVEILKAGHTEKRDVLKIGERYAVNLIGFGFDITMSEIHLNNKTLKGPLLYFHAIIMAIFKHKGFRIKVESETGEIFEGKSLMLNLGNNKISGGGYMTCPKADMTDGKMDVMFVKDCSPWARLKLLQMVKKTNHLKNPLVHYTQTKSVNVESEVPIAFHTEGELFYTDKKSIPVKVLPSHINLIVE